MFGLLHLCGVVVQPRVDSKDYDEIFILTICGNHDPIEFVPIDARAATVIPSFLSLFERGEIFIRYTDEGYSYQLVSCISEFVPTCVFVNWHNSFIGPLRPSNV